MATTFLRLDTSGRPVWHRNLWIALVLLMSVAGSYIYACAAPFAAIAAIAAVTLPRNEGLASIVAALAINQFIGFAVLGYPQTVEAAIWGAVIAGGTMLAYGVSAALARQLRPGIAQIAGALCVALFAFEAAIYAAAIMLSPDANNFTVTIVEQIFAINFAAAALAIISHQLMTGLSTYFERLPAKA